jgi:hypothetical protein
MLMLSYNVQIDLIIEKLKLRGGKVLILISECYTRKIIPNSIAVKRNGTSSVKIIPKRNASKRNGTSSFMGTSCLTAEDEVTLLICLC